MKKWLLSLFVLLSFSLAAQQAKQVYITLDVSGSMYGAKYELANYTTQMIVSLCEKNDDVYFVIGGNVYNLTSYSNPLSFLQQPIKTIDLSATENADIIKFCKVYKPSSKKQNWLFVIGDGDWDYPNCPSSFSVGTTLLRTIVENNTLNVCYLQTGESLGERNPFTDFASSLDVVDIRKSDINPVTIELECDHFARKILGFSNVSLGLKKGEPHEVTFSLKLPVSEFLIVYQDETSPNYLPNIRQVSANGQSLHCQLKGTPSTEKLSPLFGTMEYYYWRSHVSLSGKVWKVKSSSPIPVGQSVTVSFDKDVDLNNVRIYPICKNITTKDFIPVPISIDRQLEDLHSGTYAICREKDKATIIISLSENAEKTIPEELLKNSKVKVLANNTKYTASYENGHFTCDIKLKSDKTPYNAEIDIPGYLHLTTPFQTIEKTDKCEEEKEIEKDNTVDTVLPPVPIGEVQFQQHMVLKFTLSDKKSKKLLNPNDFDLGVTLENSFLFEDPKITVRGDTIYLFIDTKADWCECLLPKELKGNITASPKKGIVFENGKVYSRAIQPFQANLKRDTWLARCKWALCVIGGLIILIIYLRMLLRKNRFKKNAMINPYSWSKIKDEYIPMGGYRLRKKGFAAWFSRWFLPFDEKRSIAMNTPLANFTFTATESRSRIKFPKSDFNQDTMIVTGYDPAFAKKKDTHIKLPDGGTIELLKNDGSKDGKLQFVAGKKNDEGFYHFLLGLFVLADTAAIVFLFYLMIKAII